MSDTRRIDARRAAVAGVLALPPIAMGGIALTFGSPSAPWLVTLVLLAGPATDLALAAWGGLRLVRNDRVGLPAALNIAAALIGLVLGIVLTTGWGAAYVLETLVALAEWGAFDHSLRELSAGRFFAWAMVGGLSALRLLGWTFIAGLASRAASLEPAG